MISHVPSWSVHIKKCQKKLGRDALNASSSSVTGHERWRKRDALSFPKKKNPLTIVNLQKVLFVSNLRLFSLHFLLSEQCDMRHDITRNRDRATHFLCFSVPPILPSYHRWYERKQANYRVGIEGWSDRSYSLDKRCWGYVYMITSASLRTHALRRPLFSSQKLQALEDTQQIFKIGNFGDEAFYLLAGVYYANNSTIINNNNSKLDF